MRSLWVARDGACPDSTGFYQIFTVKPRWDERGWWHDLSRESVMDVEARALPFKLKPGGGPVKVRIVKEKP